ncbi:hypothetical protein LSH36_108g05015, partial [Paralvinella palmiformis]
EISLKPTTTLTLPYNFITINIIGVIIISLLLLLVGIFVIINLFTHCKHESKTLLDRPRPVTSMVNQIFVSSVSYHDCLMAQYLLTETITSRFIYKLAQQSLYVYQCQFLYTLPYLIGWFIQSIISLFNETTSHK